MKTVLFYALALLALFVFQNARAQDPYPNADPYKSNLGTALNYPWEESCFELDEYPTVLDNNFLECRVRILAEGESQREGLQPTYDDPTLDYYTLGVDSWWDNDFLTGDSYHVAVTKTASHCPSFAEQWTLHPEVCTPVAGGTYDNGLLCPDNFAAYSGTCYPDVSYSECETYATSHGSSNFGLITYPNEAGNPSAVYCEVSTDTGGGGGGSGDFDDTNIVAGLNSVNSSVQSVESAIQTADTNNTDALGDLLTELESNSDLTQELIDLEQAEADDRENYLPGDFYTQQNADPDLTAQIIAQDAITNLTNTNLGSAMTNFFDVDLSGGQCPTWSADIPLGTTTYTANFDYLCSSVIPWAFIQSVIILSSILMAHRIAFG